jgi:hypothetical protein
MKGSVLITGNRSPDQSLPEERAMAAPVTRTSDRVGSPSPVRGSRTRFKASRPSCSLGVGTRGRHWEIARRVVAVAAETDATEPG